MPGEPVAPELPSLAATSSSGLSPAMRWFGDPPRVVPWLILPIVVVQVINIVLTVILSDEACPSFDECFVPYVVWVVVSSIVASFAFLLTLALTIGRARGRALSSDERGKYAPRLQSVKDWYMRGEIGDEDYERLRKPLQDALDGKVPALAFLRARRSLFVFGIFLAVVLSVLLIFALATLEAATFGYDPTAFPSFLVFIGATLVWLPATILAFVQASRAGRRYRETMAAFSSRIDQLEMEILRSGRERHGGPSPSRAPRGGPSFRSFPGR